MYTLSRSGIEQELHAAVNEGVTIAAASQIFDSSDISRI